MQDTDRSPISQGPGPSHDTAMEVAVLGGILYDRHALPLVADLLSPDIFHLPAHKTICHAILGLVQKSVPVDLVTLYSALLNSGELDSCGGPHYLSSLTDKIVHTANIEYHAKLLVDMSLRRCAIAAGKRLQADAAGGGMDYMEAIESATATLKKLGERSVTQPSQPVSAGFVDVIDQIIVQAQNGGALTGVDTGFRSLNHMTCGWQPGNLVILAARPAMGKTAFMLALARQAAVADGVPTLVFSLEMTAVELKRRMILSEAGIDNSMVRMGCLMDDDIRRMVSDTGRLMNSPLYINDKSGLSIAELGADARRMKKQRGIGMVFVDYLQLMSGSGSNRGNREQEVSEISRGLKNLAKELMVPVVSLSQLSREVEKTSDKKPRMSHIRESGAIEQDADIVMFLHRPEYYGTMTDSDGYSTAGLCEVIVAKQRNGPVGECRLTFMPSTGKFYDKND